MYTQCLSYLPEPCLCRHNVFLSYPTHVCVGTMSFLPTRHMSVYTQCLSYLPDTCLCTHNVFLTYPIHVCVRTMSVCLPDTYICTDNFLSVCLPLSPYIAVLFDWAENIWLLLTYLLTYLLYASALTRMHFPVWREVFRIFDKDNNGRVSAAEVGTLLRGLDLNPTQRDIEDIIRKIDRNGE